jgi:hypothetical protein
LIAINLITSSAREIGVSVESIAEHPHRPLLIAAYRQFLAGQPGAALALLEPVVERDELANRPSAMGGLLWGLAGDCYFRLVEPEKGFQAYRRAIACDGRAGCLTFFACQVAWHRRAEDVEEAFQCLRAARAADRWALRQFLVHFLWHSIGMERLYHRFVRIPLVRWRLWRLSRGAPSVSHFSDLNA